MKKTIILAMVCIMAFSAFAGCNDDTPVNPVEMPTDKIWSAPNTKIYRRDEEPTQYNDAKLSFVGVKGEVESAQFLVTAADNIDAYSVEVGDALHENGKDKIAAEQFEVAVAKYMNVTVPTTDFPKGWYPDAIVPYDKIVAKGENKIKIANNQSFWINLNIPAQAESGEYSAKVSLNLDGREHEIPVSVKVYDLLMPEEVHVDSAFAVWWWQIPFGEGEITDIREQEELYNNYYDFLLTKRVTPTDLPPLFGSSESFAEQVVERAQDPRVTGYNLPYRAETFEDWNVISYDYAVEILTALANKNIQLRKAGDTTTDLFEKAYFYLGSIIDEPMPGVFPAVKECDKRINDAKNEVAQLLGEYPDLQESVLKVGHVVTKELTEQLYGSDTEGGVQTWCPTIEKYHSAEYRRESEIRRNTPDRKYGEETWWYTCVNPKNPFPSYHLDDNLISSRVMRWMQHDYDVTGSLFWNVCMYQKYTGANGYVDRDIWVDPLTWPGANSDGLLVYPGKDYGIKGPISTIRLESIRESNEDYEYLWMLEEQLAVLDVKYGTQTDIKEYIRNLYDSLYSGVIPYIDDNEFIRTRLELLDILQAAKGEAQALINVGSLKENKKNVDIYFASDCKVKINGKEVDIAAENGYKHITYTAEMKAGENAVTIEFVKDGETIASVNRRLGNGGVENGALEEGVWTVNNVEGAQNLKVEVVTPGAELGLRGKALKISSTYADAGLDLSYRPYITLNAEQLKALGIDDMSGVKGIEFDVYNYTGNDADKNNAVKSTILTASVRNTEKSTFNTTEALIYPQKTCRVKLDFSGDIGKAEYLRLYMEMPEEGGEILLYLDNLIFIY